MPSTLSPLETEAAMLRKMLELAYDELPDIDDRDMARRSTKKTVRLALDRASISEWARERERSQIAEIERLRAALAQTYEGRTEALEAVADAARRLIRDPQGRKTWTDALACFLERLDALSPTASEGESEL